MSAVFDKPWFTFLHSRAMCTDTHDGIVELYTMMDQPEFDKAYLNLIKQTMASHEERLQQVREKIKQVCAAVGVDWKEALRLLADEAGFADVIAYLYSRGLSDVQVVDIAEKYFGHSK